MAVDEADMGGNKSFGKLGMAMRGNVGERRRHLQRLNVIAPHHARYRLWAVSFLYRVLTEDGRCAVEKRWCGWRAVFFIPSMQDCMCNVIRMDC